MADDDLSLEDLSARTGVEARTLRSWVAEGLLAPPFKPGRGARYPGANVDRALAVRALKDVHGLSMAEIGRRFMMATEQEIRDWAREGAGRAPRSSSAHTSSARDYLRGLAGRGADADPSPPEAPGQPMLDLDGLRGSGRRPPGKEGFDKPPPRRRREAVHPDDLAGIERLLIQLEQVLDGPAPRRARGAVWTRIAITPDLELSVRGDLAPHERVLFEQLADQFRAILTGRTRP